MVLCRGARCFSCRWRKHSEPLLPHAYPWCEETPRKRTQSQPHSPGRMQSLMEEKSSFLNRGLGALRTQRVEPEGEPCCSTAMLVLFLGALVTIPSVLLIEISFVTQRGESFFSPDLTARAAGGARIAAIPLTCGAVNFLIRHIRQTTFWWERTISRTRCGCDPLALWPMLFAALGLLHDACLRVVNGTSSYNIAYYIEILMTFIALRLYYALLDQVNAIVKGMVQEQEVINNTEPVKKMQNLVRNITRSGKEEKDRVYCFARTNTVPAEVFSYVWWLYYIAGKVLGGFIALALVMGMEKALISHFLMGGIFLSAATASGFMFELGPNTLSLFRLSLNKPFYVGDLVTLNSNGAMDAGATSIMGFVENITMMYVVIRNFEMKQTWIPHKAFGAMIIQNWTRRPSKTVLLNVGISCRCPVIKVEQLTAFGKRWIQASSEIQQTNYQKCHITKIGNGYNIEVIFFPAIGVSHRGIRQKFLVAFMGAAERMHIPFVPLQLMQNFCEENATAPRDANGSVVDDALLEDLLPDPNDPLPKGVGLGFREFPRNGSKADVLARL